MTAAPAVDDWGINDKPAARGDTWGESDLPAKPPQAPSFTDKAKGLMSGLGTAPILHLVDTAKSMAGMVAHPGDTLDAMEQGREQTVDRAVDALHKGNYGQTAIHGVLSLIPMIGPTLSQHYQEMRDAQDKGDDVAEANAAGKMLGLAASAEAVRAMPAAGRTLKAVAEATPHIVDAISDSGAAGDVAAGTAKTVAGAGLGFAAHKLGLGPLVEYLAAKGLIKNGATQAAGGIRDAYNAFKQGVSDYQYSQIPKTSRGGIAPVEQPPPPAFSPTAPAALPSGRVPGPVAPQPPPTIPPRAPVWQGVGSAEPPATPQFAEPGPAALPSGRLPGSIANQTVPTPRDDMAVLDGIAKQLNKGRSFARSTPAEQAQIRDLASRIQPQDMSAAQAASQVDASAVSRGIPSPASTAPTAVPSPGALTPEIMAELRARPTQHLSPETVERQTTPAPSTADVHSKAVGLAESFYSKGFSVEDAHAALLKSGVTGDAMRFTEQNLRRMLINRGAKAASTQ